jgi:hypothetical protein
MSLLRTDVERLAAMQREVQALVARADSDSTFDALVGVNECLAIATAYGEIEVDTRERIEGKQKALTLGRGELVVCDVEEPGT